MRNEMSPKMKTALIWIAAILVTYAFAKYQRATGPTYPLSVETHISNTDYNFTLPRSHGGDDGQEIALGIPNKDIKAQLVFKRFKSYDDWTTTDFVRTGDTLKAEIPHQPPAGKVMYKIQISDSQNLPSELTKEPVVIRFKGAVPMFFLLIHIILIFTAFLLSMRTGFEAAMGRDNTYKLTMLTIIFLFLGGLVFGPIIQQYAFGAYWTGWPWGHDLTDNKTLVAFIMWLVAMWRLRKNPEAKYWAIIASLVLVVVYLIPHSVLGSEIDYTQLPKQV